MVELITWITIGVVSLIFIIAVYYFNRFIVLENRIENSTAQIDVQLRKRADLVPSLVKVVQGYAKHEKKIMEDVNNARKALLRADKEDILPAKMQAGDKLQSALKSIFAIAENYPDLKANQNFLHLQQELSAIEDKVAYSRQFYNDSVMDYQNTTERIPGVLFFKLYGRKHHKYLEIPEASRAVPKIDL